MREIEQIVKADPLLNNAEAEWFKNQFEQMAVANGFASHLPRRETPERPLAGSASSGRAREPIRLIAAMIG